MNEERLSKIIVAPVVSEKSTKLADRNRQYAFRVLPDATKREIKAAVSELFKVEVTGVQVCNVQGKKKIFRNIRGKRRSWKKAYVTLKEGQEIQFAGEK